MATLKPFSSFLIGLLLFFCFVRPTLAFGAGNIASISSVEGQNWRHGDIEDALLKIVMARAVGGQRFDKLMVARVYFGNWLRDYSQAIDIGTVKFVSAEAIRLLLCILGFLTFGYGSREFEVTAERLGCYRPEDHIDNPKGYGEGQDPRQYDPRLRGPVDEETELAIDEETGMKNYIANEKIGIMTSAKHVRNLFGKCIELGREYGRSGNKDDLYEALRLLGTGLHCLEDFFAHSNYTELALIELGERDVFPHVGRNTKLRIPGTRGSVYPIVTGTFGGVDFLHSVTGEVSDKMIQSEIDDLEGMMKQYKNGDTSILRDLLDKIPDGLIGGKKDQLDDIQQNAQAAQVETLSISPRDPEEVTQYAQQVFAQIMPAIQFHDELLQDISRAINKVPILPKIIEQLEEQLSLWVFSIIAPFVIPLIEQIKNELQTGSSEIIESSKREQHIVFEDDDCSDPTHSMLSKDHFTNILNEIAGRTASKVVSWVVPQIMSAWDDEDLDVDSLLNKIIYGVLHHPAQRDMGPDGAEEGRQLIFESIRTWWEDELSESQREEYRRKLSREGVENGENHKEGQKDCGHGCGGKLKMKKNYRNEAPQTVEDKIAGAAAGAIVDGLKMSVADVAQGKITSGGTGSGFGSFLSSLTDNILSAGSKRFKEELGRFGKGEEEEEEEEKPSYSSGGYGGSSSGYGRKNDDEEEDEEERPSYGGYGRRRDDEEEDRPSYGGGYGGGYGRRDDDDDEERPSYGGGYDGGYGGYHRRRDDDEEEEERPTYGGGYGGYYRRRDDDEDEGYGGGRHHGWGY